MKAVLKPKRGVFLEIWIQFSSLKTKKNPKIPVFCTVQRTLHNYFECSKYPNMPGGFLSILLHFFMPLPAQQFQPWECSNNPEHLKLGEREEGRQKSAFQHTTTICTLPRINNRTKRICLETAPPHAYSVGNQEPKLAGQPWSQRAGSPVLCFV